MDNETVGENVYLNIISQAKKYVFICTPYLIIDNEMMMALCLAAKKGVDVRIITPGIPDKKMVFLLTQSYYKQLIEAGVRVYEYTPGFVHSKTFVCDDEIATVGTINLDYRSLYLHFECGVWMYQSQAVREAKEDMEATLPKCKEVSLDFCNKRNIFVRGIQSIMQADCTAFIERIFKKNFEGIQRVKVSQKEYRGKSMLMNFFTRAVLGTDFYHIIQGFWSMEFWDGL